MILSHAHRFIFIKGLKVAGTSVEIALSQICGPDDIVTPITPADERYRLGTAGEPKNYATDRELERVFVDAIRNAPNADLAGIKAPRGPFTNHMPLANVLALVPEAANYQVLFTERCPYQKVLSRSVWRAHRRAYEAGQDLRAAEPYADLVHRTIDDGSLAKVRNIDRYRDRSGALPSAGWRFETLERDLREFVTACGAAPAPLVHAKRGPGSSRIDVRTALRKEQIARINTVFADEFDAFGYEMMG